MKLIITEEQFNKLILNKSMTSKSESKIVSLVEKRGMFKNYETLIVPIKNYINKYINENEPSEYSRIINKETNQIVETEIYNFKIPQSMLINISWAEQKNIDVNIINVDENNLLTKDVLSSYRNANFNMNEYTSLNQNDKLEQLNINLVAFAVNKNVYSQQVTGVLYHELTHAFEEYNRAKSNKQNLYGLTLNSNYNEIINFNDNSDENIKLFYELNYKLLVKSELNANIASVYGDLETINSIRRNFKDDIKKTDAYIIYNNVKNNVLPILNKLNNDYWEIFKNESYLQKKRTNINIPTNIYKKEFNETVNYKLNILLKGIGKVATQYYDDTETKINITKKNLDNINGWSII